MTHINTVVKIEDDMEDLEHETKGLIISGLSINESYISGSDHDSSFIGDCSTALLSPKQGEPQRTNEDARVEQNTLYQYIRLVQGPLHLLVLCMAFALAIGATIGVVPTVMTDQYARLYHGYKDDTSCAEYPFQLKPKACIQGFNDAQTANTMASFISNGLTFLTSSLIGSFSDEFGRRRLLLLSQGMSILPSFCLVLSQLDNTLNPRYYYLSSACSGIISWIAIALSSISDVIPKKWRATCFGLLLSSFSVGFAIAPLLALKLSHLQVSIVSLHLLIASFFYAVLFLKETLPHGTSERASSIRSNRIEASSCWTFLWRPFTELAILNRDTFFRLLSCLAFFSGASSSGDQSMLIYYSEEYLDFDDGDIATLFAIAGFLGIAVQAFLLRFLLSLFGERLVVVIAFLCGAIHNVMYAFASSKVTIFAAVAVGTLIGTSFPVVSAMKSNNVEEHEQGRIQGALYALTSLAAALGPLSLRFTYQFTKDTRVPGSFFLVGTFLYILATICAYFLPKHKANSA